MRFDALENWHSWLQFTFWHKQGIMKGTLRKTRSKLSWWNLHAFSMGKTDFTKMRIFSERLNGFWWDLALWKTDILGFNSLIYTDVELWREHWEKLDQSCSGFFQFFDVRLIFLNIAYQFGAKTGHPLIVILFFLWEKVNTFFHIALLP